MYAISYNSRYILLKCFKCCDGVYLMIMSLKKNFDMKNKHLDIVLLHGEDEDLLEHFLILHVMLMLHTLFLWGLSHKRLIFKSNILVVRATFGGYLLKQLPYCLM